MRFCEQLPLKGDRLEREVSIQLLIDDEPFQAPDRADATGVVAMGGLLTVPRLLEAYRRGIFPWYSDEMPVLWHSPDPRMVLLAQELHVGRSLRKQIARQPYELTMDRAFCEVMMRCSEIPRPGQDGTWITGDMQRAYRELHAAGYAHSIEAWEQGQLVGGLYGVSIGGAFFGESMFACRPDASKIAFVQAVRQMQAWGIDLIDCQVHTEHLERFGGVEWPRPFFLAELAKRVQRESRIGAWAFDIPLG